MDLGWPGDCGLPLPGSGLIDPPDPIPNPTNPSIFKPFHPTNPIPEIGLQLSPKNPVVETHLRLAVEMNTVGTPQIVSALECSALHSAAIDGYFAPVHEEVRPVSATMENGRCEKFYVGNFDGDASGKVDVVVHDPGTWSQVHMQIYKAYGVKMHLMDRLHVADFNQDGRGDIAAFL
jgi:hypothetical protein